MTGFNLRDLVLAEFDRSADPHVVADAVLGKVDRKDLAVALAVALPAYVRTLRREPTSSDQAHSDTHVDRVAVGRPHAEATANARRAGLNRGRAWMQERALGDGEWKQVADFTFADCVAASEERRLQSKSIAARADFFDRLAEALKKHEVATIKDLPDSVLEEIR